MFLSSFTKLLVTLTLVVPNGTTKIFDINPTNTEITFSAKHMSVLNVKGKFTDFKGTIVLDNDVVKSALVEINVNTINTGNKNRDKSLKTDVFLHPEAYPLIRFESKDNRSSSEINGTLTIKDTSNLAVVNYTTEFKNQFLILSGSYTLSREEFNLAFGSMNSLVSDKVKVQIKVSLKLS